MNPLMVTMFIQVFGNSAAGGPAVKRGMILKQVG